jgi:protein-S-isoprenylcysteine O-methyltransferase Ste14
MDRIVMKGVDQLRAKLPAFHGPRVLLLPSIVLLSVLAGLLFLIGMDILPRLYPESQFLFAMEPVLPIAGGLILGGIGILLVSGLWRNKEKAIQRYGELAYQKLLPRGIAGVVLVLTVAIHSFLSVRSLVATPPVNDITTALSKSFLSLIGISANIDVVVRGCLGIPVILLAALLVRRAILTFGLDYMMVMYLFFPEESEVKDNEIYSVIRHPTYFSGILLAFGGFLLRLSFYSLAFVGIVYLIFRVHLRYEEGELIERFGNSYEGYMDKVPGLYVRPRDIRIFLRFIRGANTEAQ